MEINQGTNEEGVLTISISGDPLLTGNVTLSEGSNITLTQVGNDIEISASGSGSIAIGDTIASAIEGSVLFAGAAGVLAQDNANFFWDDTNNRLGIGTASPQDPLHVVVGSAVAEIGRFETTTNLANVIFGFKDNSPGQARVLAFNFLNAASLAEGQIAFFNNSVGASQYMSFSTNEAERMRIDGSGNVGIGTISPLAKLHIAGNLFAYAPAGTYVTGSVHHLLAVDDGIVLGIQTTSNAGGSATVMLDDTGTIQASYGWYNSGAGGGIASSFVFFTHNANPINFFTNSLLRMTIAGSGNVGIGNTSPGALLDIGTAGTTLGTFRLEGNTSGYVQLQPAAAAGSWTMTLPASTGTINQVLQTNGSGVTSWATVALTSGNARATAQTGANTNVLTVAVGAADGTFQLLANVLVTVSTVHSFGVTVDYTDESNTARTLTIPVAQLAGTLITAITNGTGVGPYEGVALTIRAKASTNIVFKTAGTFTTVTYNVDCSVIQIA